MPTAEQQLLFSSKDPAPTIPQKKNRDAVFRDYESFVRKFTDRPKTTDDCYTPQPVYDAIVSWIDREVTPLEGRTILRPFYPGGDYEAVDYRPGDIVIDNPPFSILAKIRRFYASAGVDYFLFAPSLTLFSGVLAQAETFIVAAASIKYQNGAIVRTSFVTNCYPGDIRIAIRGDLYKTIDSAQPPAPLSLPKYIYPDTVVSSALLNKIAERGVSLEISAKECYRIATLDSQRVLGKSIFGGGYLLSERAAAETAAAERAAARECQAWELSQREIDIIKQLNKNADNQ